MFGFFKKYYEQFPTMYAIFMIISYISLQMKERIFMEWRRITKWKLKYSMQTVGVIFYPLDYVQSVRLVLHRQQPRFISLDQRPSNPGDPGSS